jgi:hypothetical protein
MSTTNPKMVALLEKQAEERDRLEAEIIVEAALPEVLQPHVSFVYRHSRLHGGYTAIKLKKEPKGYRGAAFTLRQALRLRDAFAREQDGLVETTVGKDSCTHVQPAWDAPKGQPYWGVESANRFPWFIKTDIHGDASLHFYATINSLKLLVEIELGGYAYRLTRHKTRSFGHGEVTLYDRTEAVAVPGARFITWSGGGSKTNPREVSLFPADPTAVVEALEPQEQG